MRPRLMTFALWLVATALAVTVGISATRLVANRVAGPDVTIPIDLAQGPSAASAGASPSPSPVGSPPPVGESPSPVAPPPPGASPSPPSSPSPPAAAPAVETRTISVVGGSAALRFVDGRVEVIWATPNAGFTADVESDPDDAEARVDFRASDHRSRIKGEWDGGRPVVETEERPDD